MPGILGIVETGERLTSGTARRLMARLQAPAERVTELALGHAAMVHAGLGLPIEQGGVACADGLLVAATGWVAGLDRLWREVAASGLTAGAGGDRGPAWPGPHGTTGGGAAESEAPLARLCLERYRRHGADGIAELNGIYAVAVWSQREGALTLVQDRLGAAGLCYHIEAGRLAFASRPRALAPLAACELDGRALGHLLTVGYPLGDRTLWRDIRMLGPASICIWRDGRMLVRRTWAPPPAATDPDDERRGVEELEEALAAAMRDAVSGLDGDAIGLALPLSGGLDSRTLLGHARRHLRPSTYSYGHGHSWDRRFGARLARVAGTRHRQIDLGRDFMARYGPRLVYLTEGQAPIHASHLLCLLPALARRASVAISGYLGDALTGGHLGWVGEPDDGGAGDIGAAGAALFERAYRIGFDDQTLGVLLRRPYARDAHGAALDDFLAVYRQGDDAFARADRVDLELRQRRFIAYQLHVLGQVAAVRAPFADHRVLETCLAWPVAWRRGQRLYRRYIRERLPDLARVPVTSTGLPLAGSPPAVAFRRAWEHWRWRLMPRLSGGRLRPHDYRQYAHYDAWIRTGARGFFTELLDDRELLDEVFDTEKISDLLKAHLEGHIDAYQRLCAVATVGLWLRFFVRDGSLAASEPVLRPSAAAS